MIESVNPETHTTSAVDHDLVALMLLMICIALAALTSGTMPLVVDVIGTLASAGLTGG
jgi:hypothetical protein